MSRSSSVGKSSASSASKNESSSSSGKIIKNESLISSNAAATASSVGNAVPISSSAAAAAISAGNAAASSSSSPPNDGSVDDRSSFYDDDSSFYNASAYNASASPDNDTYHVSNNDTYSRIQSRRDPQQFQGEGRSKNYNIIKAYHSTQPWMILHKPPLLKLAPVKSQADLYEWYHIHFKSFVNSLDKYSRALLMEADTSLDTHADHAFKEILDIVEDQKILDAYNNAGDREVSKAKQQAELRRKSYRFGEAHGLEHKDPPSVESSLKQVLLDPLTEMILIRSHDLYQCLLNALQLLPLNPTLAMVTDVRSLLRQSTHPGDLWYKICKAAFIPHIKLISSNVERTYPIEDVRIQITARVREAFAKEAYIKGQSLTKFAQRLIWYQHAYDQTGQLLTENMIQHHFQHQEGIRKNEQVMRCWARIKAEAEAQQTLKSQAMIIAELLMDEFTTHEHQRNSRLQSFKRRLEDKQHQMSFLEKVQQVEVLLRVEGWSPLEDQVLGASSPGAAAEGVHNNDANYTHDTRSRGRDRNSRGYHDNKRTYSREHGSDRHSSRSTSSSGSGDNVSCYGCTGKGHMRDVCPSRPGVSNHITCYNCNGKGHTSDTCPSRPNLNGSNSNSGDDRKGSQSSSRSNDASTTVATADRTRTRRQTPMHRDTRQHNRNYSRSRSGSRNHRDYSHSRSRSRSHSSNHHTNNYSNDARAGDIVVHFQENSYSKEETNTIFLIDEKQSVFIIEDDGQQSTSVSNNTAIDDEKVSISSTINDDDDWGYYTAAPIEFELPIVNDANNNSTRNVINMNQLTVIRQTTLDSFFNPVAFDQDTNEVVVVDAIINNVSVDYEAKYENNVSSRGITESSRGIIESSRGTTESLREDVIPRRGDSLLSRFRVKVNSAVFSFRELYPVSQQF